MKIPSRRVVLAGIAAAATPIAPALATALGGLPAQAADHSSIDPIVAVIAEHRAAIKVYNEASDVSGHLPCAGPQYEAANLATQTAIRARARSALAKAFAEAEAKAAVPGADPVYAAIAAHLAASVAYHTASEAENTRKPGTPGYRAAEAAVAAAMDRDGDTLHALLISRPTTFAGLAALLEHVGQPEWFIYDRGKGTGQTILSGPHQCGSNIGDEVLAFPLHLAQTIRNLMDAPDGAAW